MTAPEPPNLIGPAAKVLAVAREIVRGSLPAGAAVLTEGDPGIGKTALCDHLARELVEGAELAIEHVNGQSLGIDLVRSWRAAGGFGTLFSSLVVKRVDEIDQASPAAVAELLTYLDYLPPRTVILATTNEYGRLRAMSKGRLESRFVHLRVEAPTVEQTAGLLQRRYAVPKSEARRIALGAVPEGCLAVRGCNVRAAMRDALGFTAARRLVAA